MYMYVGRRHDMLQCCTTGLQCRRSDVTSATGEYLAHLMLALVDAVLRKYLPTLLVSPLRPCFIILNNREQNRRQRKHNRQGIGSSHAIARAQSLSAHQPRAYSRYLRYLVCIESVTRVLGTLGTERERHTHRERAVECTGFHSSRPLFRPFFFFSPSSFLFSSPCCSKFLFCFANGVFFCASLSSATT